MSRRFKIVIVLLCALGALKGQDMHFTQFFSSPLYLNPAFAGAECTRAALTYRNQWPGINKTYKSYMLGIDHLFQSHNIGVGLLVANDVAGSGNLQTTMIHPIFAYQAKVNRELFIRGAIQPGVTMRSINFNNLLFGDQIYYGSTIEQPTQTKTFFDVGAGALAYTVKYWGGFSVYHLNRPDETLMGVEGATLPMRYTLHGGMKYVFNEDERDESHIRAVNPVFHFRGQRKFSQLDIGAYYSHGYASFGLWYRGIPFKHYKPGYPNRDAIAMILGFKTKKVSIGYSFDITISQLAGFTKGAHEVTLSYRACTQKKKKKIQVPCPKF